MSKKDKDRVVNSRIEDVCVCVCERRAAVVTHPRRESSPNTAAPSTIHCARMVSGSFFWQERKNTTQRVSVLSSFVAQIQFASVLSVSDGPQVLTDGVLTDLFSMSAPC